MDVGAAMTEAYRADRFRDLKRWFFVGRMVGGQVALILGVRPQPRIGTSDPSVKADRA